jgi:hypothetical protein
LRKTHRPTQLHGSLASFLVQNGQQNITPIPLPVGIGVLSLVALKRPLFFDELDIQRNRYFVTHQYATRVQRSIPRDPKVFAVDTCRARKTNAPVAPGKDGDQDTSPQQEE